MKPLSAASPRSLEPLSSFPRCLPTQVVMCGSRLRLSRTLVARDGLLLCASVLAGTASADTLLQKKQAQYARVRTQVRKLDSHIELLTERYDQVRWHLHVLRREIRVATARLEAEQAELERQQQTSRSS